MRVVLEVSQDMLEEFETFGGQGVCVRASLEVTNEISIRMLSARKRRSPMRD